MEEELGIKTFQIHIHRDEGHYEQFTDNWKPNLHAHMLFDWQDDETGKMLRIKRHYMKVIQDITAEVLNMERGISSDKKHLKAIQWKVKKDAEKLQMAYRIANDPEFKLEKNLIGLYKTQHLQDLQLALKMAKSENEEHEKKSIY